MVISFRGSVLPFQPKSGRALIGSDWQAMNGVETVTGFESTLSNRGSLAAARSSPMEIPSWAGRLAANLHSIGKASTREMGPIF